MYDNEYVASMYEYYYEKILINQMVYLPMIDIKLTQQNIVNLPIFDYYNRLKIDPLMVERM